MRSPILALFLILTILTESVYLASDKVICYYASWATTRPSNGQFLPEDINPNLCTHVNYAFLGLNSDGSLQILDPVNDIDQRGLLRVSALKEQNPNLKVLFSIGGASADPSVFGRVASDASLREAMAASAVQFCQTYNYDGIDVDWEYPYGGDQQKVIDLLTTLKNAFQPHGYILTAAVNAMPTEVGGYDIPGLSNVLDVINVMTYDFHWYGGGETGQNSPLFGGDNESDWQKENRNSDAAIKAWIAGGANPQKLALGLAFYGHTFTLSNPSNNGIAAPTSGPGDVGPYTNNVGTLGYNEICEFHYNTGTVVFQEDMKVPYLYDGSLWVGYDNEQSLAIKAQYAKDQNLAGVFIWSIETDDKVGLCGRPNGLLQSISDAMRK